MAEHPDNHDESAAPQDVRDGMRAALERKKQQHHAGAAGPDARKDSTIPHGNDKTQRQFRRKSG